MALIFLSASCIWWLLHLWFPCRWEVSFSARSFSSATNWPIINHWMRLCFYNYFYFNLIWYLITICILSLFYVWAWIKIWFEDISTLSESIQLSKHGRRTTFSVEGKTYRRDHDDVLWIRVIYTTHQSSSKIHKSSMCQSCKWNVDVAAKEFWFRK